MPSKIIQTRKGPLTEEKALDSDLDMIPELLQLQHTVDFRRQLCRRRGEIEGLISRHLGIPATAFSLSPEAEWISGAFNICLPIYTSEPRKSNLPRRAMIRFPLPFNVGEDFSPGSMDEKLRCEAATYIWLRRNCVAVPIPRLLGMAFPGNQTFTAIEHESWWHRFTWLFKCVKAWWRGEMLSPYFGHSRGSLTDLGYLLIEYVEDGKMLSTSWKKHSDDERRHKNLYRGLARIMLDLAKVPLPRIGSWTVNDDGLVSLTNRPLSDLTFFWNKHRIPVGIPQDHTYSSTEPFIHDMLSYQDQRMRHQLNAILSRNDGIFQLSALTALRALIGRFWDRQSREGPFVFAFNDLHQSNMFVDDDWNITSIIDLEFASVRPRQMVHVPSWLNNCTADELEGAKLEEYERLYHNFVDIVAEEEKASKQDSTYSQGLLQDWKTGRYWYIKALESSNGFPIIFEKHLQPKFFENFECKNEGMALARLWDENLQSFIDTKLKDNDKYHGRIGEIFTAAASS